MDQWSFSPDKKTILFNSNCGDVDCRHLWTSSVDGKILSQQTFGEATHGIEWAAVILTDGMNYFYLASDATHPARIFHSLLTPDRATFGVAAETWPKDFPSDRLVVPQQAIFKSGDGLEIHGQLFVPAGMKAGEKRPALGIGHGRAFREAPGRAGRGAAEYQDVVAAGKYLQSRSDVDAKHIGLWGGSYGGYLTALGLGRNSDLFAAGVDLHGVHDWPTDNWDGKNIPAELNKLAHDSSPVTSVNTWKSPVLFIHGDDDRNVYFTQTVDLVARLRAKGVEIEQLVFPDDVHDFLLHRNWLAAYHAASDFFDHYFKTPGN